MKVSSIVEEDVECARLLFNNRALILCKKGVGISGFMTIQISDHFRFGKLFRFVLPSVVMLVVTSVYGVIDGLFISNFVGKTPFAAINLIMPFSMIQTGVLRF